MFILSNELILTPSKQGGSKTVSSTHKHTTQGHTLTINEMPSHRHSIWCHNFTATGLQKTGATNETALIDQNHLYPYHDEMLDTGGGSSHSHGDTGNRTVTTSTMSPYITTYFWKRKS